MMDGTFEDRFLERRAAVAVCHHSGKKWMISNHRWLFLCILRRVVRYFQEIR
jgi:hypothetical protein